MRRQLLLSRPGDNLATHLVAALGLQQAVLDVHDLMPRPGRVETAQQRAVLTRAERELQLVAVAPFLDRGDDRMHREAVELADPAKRVLDLLCLVLQLLGQHLPGGTRMIGLLGDPIR